MSGAESVRPVHVLIQSSVAESAATLRLPVLMSVREISGDNRKQGRREMGGGSADRHSGKKEKDKE